MNLPNWIKTQTADHILHFLWTLLFIAPAVMWPNPVTAFWAGQWFWPRELVDQWAEWPLSSSKVQEIAVYEFAAMVLMVMAA